MQSYRDVLMVIVIMMCAGLLSFVVTPVVRVWAYKLNAVDVPKDDRRMHKQPIPRMGGLAIFLGFLVTTLIFCQINHQLMGILIGTGVIVLLGVLDDIFALPPVVKLLVQIGSACIPAFCGVTIEYIGIFGGKYVHFQEWSIPITVLWVVAITNAVNLIDGLDGLACGVSTISAFSILVFLLLSPIVDFNVALVAAILAGACLGFLPFNINPAKIFMGDTGALFLGFVLANISVLGFFKTNAIISFVTPFLIFGLPIIDTVTAIFRRIIKGQSPFHADRNHLHHKLIDIGFSQKQSVTILYALSALMGISGIICTAERLASAVVLMMIVVVIAVFDWKIFKSDSETREHSGLDIKEDVTDQDKN